MPPRPWRTARRDGTGKRGRRRWPIVLAIILVLLSPLAYSYAHWMLRPSSLPFGVRSVEWVRADVPLGNQLVDSVEHVYYGMNGPTKGGPQLKSLPAAGRASQPTKQKKK